MLMNPQDRRQNDNGVSEVGEAFSLPGLLPPHPCPLPQGEGTVILRLSQVGLRSRWHRCAPRLNDEPPARASAFDSPRSGGRFSLSPREGKGEGERDAANQNGRTNFAGSVRPAPRLRVDNHIECKACRCWKRARSQAHWCFERSFPLTPPSPLGRERRILRLYQGGRRSCWHRALRDSRPRHTHDPARSIRHAAANASPPWGTWLQPAAPRGRVVLRGLNRPQL